MNNIRDLVYFDLDKAMSIWSQFEGGKLEHFSNLTEETEGINGGAEASIPSIIKINMGARTSGRNLKEELKVLHHDLLEKVEERLSKVGLLSDLAVFSPNPTSDVNEIHDFIGKSAYLKVEGKSVIEDYRRISAISEKFNELSKFISRSAIESIKKSPEYLEIKAQFEQAQSEVQAISDRNERSRQKQSLKLLEQKLENMLKSDLGVVDQWILDGMQLWIKTFMPTRINFRIYPYEDFPSFQVICNLKSDCFIDQDLQHLLYGYGHRPNVPLTVTGLITSMPPLGGYNFDPLIEFENNEQNFEIEESEEENRKVFEKAFRKVFSAMEGIEDFVRYSRYPNVTVHPIAVYRNLKYELVK